LAVLLEQKIFEVPSRHKSWWMFWKKAHDADAQPIDNKLAISVKNLNKTFRTSWFPKRKTVVAVDDLSLEIPKTGIFVLLGSNG
jgi:ABC-type glutathione transport system ATPase component